MITVFKRTQLYGDEERVFWKNSRRKLSAKERSGLAAEERLGH